ncbi:MAG: ABC transporter permease [Lachnospiraceae bacterium]|nr:ABC transporter permease [Lachnospiraceae bacterium]
MFGHLYKYRLKSLLRMKEDVFWCLGFPIILCTCFFAAFSGISDKTNNFHSIPVAVVYEKENAIFKATINAVSKSDTQGEEFLNVTETDSASAKALLNDDKVDAIIYVDDDISMAVAASGLNQTAVQSFLNEFEQKSALISDIIKENPDKLVSLIGNIFSSRTYISEQKLTDSPMDEMSVYYFSLIGMAALFGGFLGCSVARQMQPNITPEGMRKSTAPVKRHTMIAAEFLAAYTLQLISMAILLFYMICVLRINLGNEAGYVALTCAAGSLVGIASGIFVGSLPIKEGMQIAIFLVYSLGSSFLSGLMVHPIKIWIEKSMPIINRINPATLIQDSLYSLVIYNTHERFFTNIITLAVISVILCTLSYLMTRRKSYANL